MTRITTAIKEAIVENALAKSGNTAKREGIAERLKQWGEAVRLESVGGAEKEAELLQMEAEYKRMRMAVPGHLRDSWGGLLRYDDDMRINLAGKRIVVKLCDYKTKKFAPQEYTMPADDPLVQQYWDLIAEEEAAEAERKQITAQVRGSVERFGSVKRLLEAWPEAKELLPADSPEAKPQLPAIPVVDLNKLLKLPTEQAAG